MENDTIMQIGIKHSLTEIDDFNISSWSQYNIQLKGDQQIDKDAFNKICSDHAQLANLLKKRPKEIQEILNDVISGRPMSAQKKARAIGLTEKDFQKSGGGVIWWLVAAVAVAILLYPDDAK